LAALELRNFLNYSELALSLVEGLTVIAGDNGQGKTNLLEAVYLLSTTRLWRRSRDAEAITVGRSAATVKGELFDGTAISVQLAEGVRKRVSVNGHGLVRASDAIGRLPCVSFSAADLPIVRGEPADRRLFLDLELAQLYPGYVKRLASYRRALDQRNALIRMAQESAQPAGAFEPWEQEMAESGAGLRSARVRYVGLLAAIAAQKHAVLADGEGLSVAYSQRDEGNSAEDLLRLFEQRRGEDIRRGSSTVGPHRDDLSIEIAEMPARSASSQGQQRTGVLAIKLACYQVSHDELGVAPVLMLDDVFSDLDKKRQGNLIRSLPSDTGQVFLTCTDASSVPAKLLAGADRLTVRAGTVQRL
jgi:DNA replication and repair protein RecF